MEFFVVLICCAIAAALGFFIGTTTMRTSTMVALTTENRKLREPTKSEVQESRVHPNGTTNYVLRDGTEITFDWSDSGLYDSGLSDSVVTIHRGDRGDATKSSPVSVKKGTRYSNNCRCYIVSKLKSTDVKEMP